VLEGLGSRPFSETQEFFDGYLSSPDTPAQRKAMALEALGNSEDDVTPSSSNSLDIRTATCAEPLPSL